MDVTTFIAPVISFATLVTVAMINQRSAKEKIQTEKFRQESEARAQLRAEEGRLNIQMAMANMDLSVANAIALKNGKCNGVMESALEKADEAKGEYNSFITKLASEQINNNK